MKADSYGHGAVQCARVALDAGVAALAVARIDEALQLRHANLTAVRVHCSERRFAEIDESHTAH